MNRRGFLGLLAGAAASATLDPEKLLWVPGRKLVSIPSPRPPFLLSPELLTRETLRALEANLASIRFHQKAYEFVMGNPAPPGGFIGHTVNVRLPPRFVVALGVGRLES